VSTRAQGARAPHARFAGSGPPTSASFSAPFRLPRHALRRARAERDDNRGHGDEDSTNRLRVGALSTPRAGLANARENRVLVHRARASAPVSLPRAVRAECRGGPARDRNVNEYEDACAPAVACCRGEMVRVLLTMAEVEWYHERYFVARSSSTGFAP